MEPLFLAVDDLTDHQQLDALQRGGFDRADHGPHNLADVHALPPSGRLRVCPARYSSPHAADGDAGDKRLVAGNHLSRAAVVVDQHDITNARVRRVQSDQLSPVISPSNVR